MKKCSSCREYKPLSDYYTHYSANGVRDGSRCRSCRNKSSKRYRDSHPNNRLLRLYNITLDGYNQLFINQEGKCKICGIHQDDLTRKLVIDHDHKSGVVRGLLCHKCNHALGQFNDDIILLKKAINYLKT